MFKCKIANDRISVNRKEQNALLTHVLEISHCLLKRYSEQDSRNRDIDLMLIPGLINEALEMLETNSLGKNDLLMEYPEIKHKKKHLKGRS